MASVRRDLDAFPEVQPLLSTEAARLIAAFEKVAPPPAPKKTERPSLLNLRRYSQALDAKDKKDVGKARQLLTEVVKDQPDFKLAQLDLLNLGK